jgi:hypothetical protein
MRTSFRMVSLHMPSQWHAASYRARQRRPAQNQFFFRDRRGHRRLRHVTRVQCLWTAQARQRFHDDGSRHKAGCQVSVIRGAAAPLRRRASLPPRPSAAASLRRRISLPPRLTAAAPLRRRVSPPPRPSAAASPRRRVSPPPRPTAAASHRRRVSPVPRLFRLVMVSESPRSYRSRSVIATTFFCPRRNAPDRSARSFGSPMESHETHIGLGRSAHVLAFLLQDPGPSSR